MNLGGWILIILSWAFILWLAFVSSRFSPRKNFKVMEFYSTRSNQDCEKFSHA